MIAMLMLAVGIGVVELVSAVAAPKAPQILVEACILASFSLLLILK